MRHRVKKTKFHRETGPRRVFMRTLAAELIKTGRMETTVIRAKAIRPFVEKLVTHAKKGTIAARRLIISRLANANVANKLFEDIAPRYKDRQGGYLRIIKSSKMRKRDATPVAIVEFVK